MAGAVTMTLEMVLEFSLEYLMNFMPTYSSNYYFIKNEKISDTVRECSRGTFLFYIVSKMCVDGQRNVQG